ncbi:MAG: sporulation protein YabP [Tyzzerella sp.]|uniref:Sporulation protein YabP n=1 Tax=Candidatus Fimicola merdigallinarum TaxID=2840819 RepID=A0A9D9DWK7_9FIRM|nr:sporulation protein YabP [Candidatus Fimicola merdigallinarum]
MAEDFKKRGISHNISIENRNKIMITGVTDVLSFDEEGVIANTEMGILIIKGSDMHVGKLNVDDGSLSIEGEVFSLEYTDSDSSQRSRNSFLGRIFR